MKKEQFKNFLANNSFAVADQQESVGSLLQQVQQSGITKIVIKKEHGFDIYENHQKFGHLMKTWDPNMKLKKFIQINQGILKNILNIERDTGLHHILAQELNNNPAGNTGAHNPDFPTYITGGARQEQSQNAAPPPDSFSPPSTNYKGFAPTAPDKPIPKAKPYFIVSEFEEEIKADEVLTVQVSLSREKGKKSSNPLKLEEGWQIDILVTAKTGLTPQSPFMQAIIVSPENVDKKFNFIFKAEKAGEGCFILMALHEGKLLFQEEYIVRIAQNEPLEKQVAKKSNLVPAKPQNSSPDLTLIIQHATDSSSKVILNYILFSPRKAFNLNYKQFESPVFQHDVATYFLDFFKAIDDTKQNNRRKQQNAVEIMKARCATLYRNLFPRELRKILWNIHGQISTIIINSQEPWIPWEICFVYSDDEGIDTGFFLCENYEISRWIPGSNSAPTELSFSNAAFVIPDSDLQFPPQEMQKIENIVQSLDGKTNEIEPSYLSVRKNMASGKFTIWHFSGHGTDSTSTNPAKFKIILDDGDEFTPEDITGLISMGAGKPLVFFNACQASKPGMSLTGLSGWPKELINNNISAFVGAYWSVRDSAAYQLSTKFYERLAAGDTISMALKTARLHTRDNSTEGDPSWLAYTLYADPFAQVNNAKP